ncbi:MAG: hypothetical protein RCO49_03580 [Rickettsia endosymbiont of Argas persicus]
MIVTFKDEIINFLKNHEHQEFTPNELAKWFVENHPEEAEQKANASKNNKMLEATTLEEKHKVIIGIYAGEISSSKLSAVRRKEPNIQLILKPKIKFYYTQNLNAQVNINIKIKPKVITNKKEKTTEAQVCEALESYLDTLNIYHMPIKHNYSSNKLGAGGNIWLHPDLVGMQVLSKEWDRLIKECAEYDGKIQAKLWSFEVKKNISIGNVRKSFFQALSNSSWSHCGYLVTAELNQNAKNELEMLCERHGIGFILIDMQNPEGSKKVIPAKERLEIDWNMANRLLKENKNFADYLIHVDAFNKTRAVITNTWSNIDKLKENIIKNKK